MITPFSRPIFADLIKLVKRIYLSLAITERSSKVSLIAMAHHVRGLCIGPPTHNGCTWKSRMSQSSCKGAYSAGLPEPSQNSSADSVMTSIPPSTTSCRRNNDTLMLVMVFKVKVPL